MHNNHHSCQGDCPICIEDHKQAKIKHKADLKHISKCRMLMKEYGFKSPSQLLDLNSSKYLP